MSACVMIISSIGGGGGGGWLQISINISLIFLDSKNIFNDKIFTKNVKFILRIRLNF